MPSLPHLLSVALCVRSLAFATSVCLLGGCTTPVAPSTSAEAAKPTSPASAAQAAPLAHVTADDEHEAYLLANPQDAAGLAERAILLNHRAAVAAADDARSLRRKARAFALAAIQAGSTNILLPMLVAGVHEDGSPVEVVHSRHPEANAHVARGEEKFARRDLAGALADYMSAWKLDPASSRIALFIGDVYYADKYFAESIEWFDRAIALAPDDETAHRYRADALMRLRRWDDAREGYIAAILADPYNRIPRGMLQHWAAERGKQFRVPDVSFPGGQLSAKDGKFELGYDPAAGTLSLAYLVARAAFCEEHQRKPERYRHRLDEEAHALRTVVGIAHEMRAHADAKAELKRHEAALGLLERLISRGLLEAHILLDRADAGIAADYPVYRAQHVDELRRYIREIWLAED